LTYKNGTGFVSFVEWDLDEVLEVILSSVEVERGSCICVKTPELERKLK
jgi:hypothetical protein